MVGISENQTGIPAKAPTLTILLCVIWSVKQEFPSSLILFLLGLSV